MKILGFIVVACLALALFKAALTVLVASYVVLLIIAMLFKPKEAIGWLGFFLLCWLLQEHPLALMATIVALCIVGVMAKRREK